MSAMSGPASAHVVPGRRMQQMQKAISAFLTALLERGMTDEDILGHFKAADAKLAEEHGQLLVDYTRQVLQQIRRNIEEECDVIYNEDDLTSKLNEVDDLCAAQPQFADGSRMPPFPTTTPDEKVRAVTNQVRIAERDRLAESVKKVESDVQSLKIAVINKRQQCQKILDSLREHASSLDHSTAAMDELPV